MLHSYAFSNFQSFRERVEVNLSLSKKIRLTDWMTELPGGERVSKLMAVIGPNGSGKTALLKAAAFIGWFVSKSFHTRPDTKIAFLQHFATVNESSEFECVFDMDGKLWRYVLRCTRDRVLHEALYQKRERFGYVFIRDWNETDNNYVVKQQDFGLAPQEAKKVRQNASLISTAAQYGVPLAVRLSEDYVITNVNLQGRHSLSENAIFAAADYFATRPEQGELMNKLLSSWDLGLSAVELENTPAPTEQDPNRTIWAPYGRHISGDTEASLPFALESSGTQGAFVLLSRLLHVLEHGGLAVIDEFENDLHPHMLEPILDLFSNPKTNPQQAQLIFTCHAIEVLNMVNKAQVTLVEKDDQCESSACRLDEVEGIRNDDNFYAKYMAGAYGAIPRI